MGKVVIMWVARRGNWSSHMGFWPGGVDHSGAEEMGVNVDMCVMQDGKGCLGLGLLGG